jgi:hypothetical protein
MLIQKVMRWNFDESRYASKFISGIVAEWRDSTEFEPNTQKNVERECSID